ncbi:MAG: polysaccharide polymerase [Spirulinaceae cyanobacterium SM2_1_0]|nr:polysaccharide polymerase [Spirulinaceae cyanobacterium SM2_1_0]
MVSDLPQILAEALTPLHPLIPPGTTCALLDYPSYPNLGDHLIWLGAVLYLRDRHCHVAYTASVRDFDADQLDRCLPADAPILLNGGGNFGDLWPRYQQFREAIAARYPQRPLIVLPQTLYFTDTANLQRAAAEFNRHPNLTLCLRDRRSLAIARDAFTDCRLVLAPDMAFHLAGQPGFAPVAATRHRLLYLCRGDREQPTNTDPALLALLNLTVADWPTFGWWLGAADQPRRQQLAGLARNLWQRGLTTPREWWARQQWQRASQPDFRAIAPPARQIQSWSFVHAGIYQFQQHRAVISNRLHGHILALLLEIPHIFLANSYHKNVAFYEAWTKAQPHCEFADSLSAVRPALERLGVPL